MTGIFIQTEDGYADLWLADGDHWARSDGSVFVYDNEADAPVAEIAAEHFVSASRQTEESTRSVTTDIDKIPREPDSTQS